VHVLPGPQSPGKEAQSCRRQIHPTEMCNGVVQNWPNPRRAGQAQTRTTRSQEAEGRRRRRPGGCGSGMTRTTDPYNRGHSPIILIKTRFFRRPSNSP